MKIRTVVMRILTALVVGAVVGAARPAFAQDLTWRHIDLTQQGFAKGANLPLSVGSAAFNFQFLYPGPVPQGVKPNTLLVFGLSEYWAANQLMGPNGRPTPVVPQVHLDAYIQFIQFLYFYPWQPSNPHFRFFDYLIVPLGVVQASLANPETGGISGAVGTGGIGDILWEPLGLLMTNAGDDFAKKYLSVTDNLEFFVSFPSGFYDRLNPLNMGSNTWGFLPLTEFWFQPGEYFGPLQNITTNSIFAWWYSTYNNNFTMPASIMNYNPSLGMALMSAKNQVVLPAGSVQRYQTGSLFLYNNDIWYNVWKGLRLGMTINYLQQVTPDLLDGSQIRNSEMQEVSVGPSAFLTLGNWLMFLRVPFNIRSVNAFDLMMAQFSIGYLFTL